MHLRMQYRGVDNPGQQHSDCKSSPLDLCMQFLTLQGVDSLGQQQRNTAKGSVENGAAPHQQQQQQQQRLEHQQQLEQENSQLVVRLNATLMQSSG